MKRKILLFTVSIVMLFSMFTFTASAASIPAAWKAPASLYAVETNLHEFTTSVFFSIDSDLIKFIDPEQTDHDALGINSIGHTAQIDWKLNNGNWHYTSDWDKQEVTYDFDSGIYCDTGYLSGETTDEKLILDLRSNNGEDTQIQKELGAAIIKGTDPDGNDNRLDLENNTIYFRVRFLVSYYDVASNENKYILSPWSETLAYGKEGSGLVKPDKLEKPTISDPIVGKNQDGSPKISFTAITPKQVQDSNNYIQAKDASHIEVEHQMNINNTGWVRAEAGGWWLGSETRSVDVPVTYDNGKEVKIDSAYIQIRMRYTYKGGANIAAIQSEWSNIIAVNTPAWENASSWATAELSKANEYGFITDKIKSNMSANITREEFAEIAVKLYEKYTGKVATAGDASFVDTKNPEILKAANLGLVTGVGNNKYAPSQLVTREQMATILLRALKVINPTADFSTEGASKFSDDNKVKSWAREGVYYCARAKIVTGVGNSMFDPEGNATREAAVIVCTRAYEFFKK